MLTILLLSSTEEMRRRRIHYPFPLRDLMKVPTSRSGPLIHWTAHQMRDVDPNRWWER